MYNDILNTEGEEIELEWDESKRKANLDKHGADFIIAAEIFAGFTFTKEDQRQDYRETRFIAYGLIRGKLMTMVYTHRGNKIRIISLRKSHEKEAHTFWQHERSHRLGEN